jgi:hypothetical protein
MSRFSLSNLHLRSNLLSLDYQQELARITVFEVKDTWRRCPLIRDPGRLTPEQRREWTDSLFWGDHSVSMADGDRARAWLELLAEALPAAVEELEAQPDLERAFEILVVTEQLRTVEMDSHYRSQGARWGDRVYEVLARDEFRLPRDLVDQRLAELVGRPAPSKRRPARPVRSGAVTKATPGIQARP